MPWRETIVSVKKSIEIRSAHDEREVDEAHKLASRVFGPNYFTARENQRRVR